MRPFLLGWHTRVRASAGELTAEDHEEFDRKLEELRTQLGQYTDALAPIAGTQR